MCKNPIVLFVVLLIGVQILLLHRVEAAVVLQYHHVSTSAPRATRISPELFSQHLAYIKENGYRVVPLYEFTQALENNGSLPDKTLAITFDDGYISVYTEAYPLLKQYGFPFTVFLNTKPVEQNLPQFISWDQINEMVKNGASIANHSYSHPHLIRKQSNLESAKTNQVDEVWQKDVLEEILRSQRSIEKNVGKQKGNVQSLFAYPYGEYDEALKTLLRDHHIIAFGQHSGSLSSRADLQSLPRFPFAGDYGGMEDFITKISSLPLPVLSEEALDEKGTLIKDTVLPDDVLMPRLKIWLADDAINLRVKCYGSGQGELEVEVVIEPSASRKNIPQEFNKNNYLIVTPKKPIPVGRSRFNCTAISDQSNRYYWYSYPFIRKELNGSWYSEP